MVYEHVIINVGSTFITSSMFLWLVVKYQEVVVKNVHHKTIFF